MKGIEQSIQVPLGLTDTNCWKQTQAMRTEGIITNIEYDSIMRDSPFRMEYANSNPRPIIRLGWVYETLDMLNESQPGMHNLLIYPNLASLRLVYSIYTMTQLEDNNKIVLILPYYEKSNSVRLTLSGISYRGNIGSSNIRYSGIRKYEGEGSLMIMDSLRGYFPFESLVMGTDDKNNLEPSFLPFVRLLSKQAARRKKAGLVALFDMGSFFHYDGGGCNNLLEYEKRLSDKFGGMELTEFCLYHKKDFEHRLAGGEKEGLYASHDLTIS